MKLVRRAGSSSQLVKLASSCKRGFMRLMPTKLQIGDLYRPNGTKCWLTCFIFIDFCSGVRGRGVVELCSEKTHFVNATRWKLPPPLQKSQPCPVVSLQFARSVEGDVRVMLNGSNGQAYRGNRRSVHILWRPIRSSAVAGKPRDAP